jgi:CxxC motif-containing protein (DUF1111 family)
MSHRSQPPAARRSLDLRAAWLLVAVLPIGIGCSSPPALDAGTTGGSGPITFTRIGGASSISPRTASLVPDRGVRADASGAGGPYAGLSAREKQYFQDALDVFKEVDAVSTETELNVEELGGGLGPTFNAAGCAECHKQPEVGGSSPHPKSPQKPDVQNPQIVVAQRDGATNTIPFFVDANGPVREARFRTDGGVHGLFTIAGRSDAPGCVLAQPDFTAEEAKGNLSFRIPTPVFGLGLVEATPDAVLEANLADNLALKQLNGIHGVFNRSGNDGTITRFGWKAQNKSLAVFAGEAYNVEQGVSNELFMNERIPDPAAKCVFNSTPEDHTNNDAMEKGTPIQEASDVIAFAMFMRLSAAPTPVALTTTTQHGKDLFNQVGCNLCHGSSLGLVSGNAPYTGMSNSRYFPYSDFAVHHMGSDLDDGVSQGGATGDMFRTAPLWGIGQRIFFLHDGRTADLGEAVEFHDSPGSEAHQVIQSFNMLGPDDQQALLDFLRSL